MTAPTSTTSPPQPRTTWWVDVRDHMPDDEITVLVYTRQELHALAYHCGEHWLSSDTDQPLASPVTHWADPPDPPSWN